MSATLLILLPSRPHLGAQGRPTPSGGVEQDAEFDYLLCDGPQVRSQGRAAAAALPRADSVIALPAMGDLSWMRLTLPKAPRHKLRAALSGVLEERLLEDTESLHVALEPERSGGDEAWVCVCHRAALLQALQTLEQANVLVDRVAPLAWPDQAGRGHFQAQAAPDTNSAAPLALSWSDARGQSLLSLEGGLGRQLLGQDPPATARWTAEPEQVARAEQWLGHPVSVLSASQLAIEALQGPWNLRQFELAPRTRGLHALRQRLRQFMSPAWRPVRIGLLGLALAQLVGLNVAAWRQQHLLQARRAEMSALLVKTFPQVRVVFDAAAQMRKESERLRAAAGQPGDGDFETLLAAASGAWPLDRPPVEALSFEPGLLTLSANGWPQPQIDQFRKQLQSEGWQLELRDGRMLLSRAGHP